jgi:hypothetical protein
MKVWIYVEGASDRLGLEALLEGWRQKLKKKGWGIQVIPLEGKSRYFRKIGPHTVEKLLANDHDLVVGLPDYYPNKTYANTDYKHATLKELLDLQKKLVNDILLGKKKNISDLINRFYPSAMKHDLEMLLLAACEQLCIHLGTEEQVGKKWRHPVEEQDQDKPPKYVVEALYKEKKGRKYRETVDSVAVLKMVGDIKKIVYSESGQLECPVFKSMLDWIGEKTGVPAY